MKKMIAKKRISIIACVLALLMFSSTIIAPMEAEAAIYANYTISGGTYSTTSYFNSSDSVVSNPTSTDSTATEESQSGTTQDTSSSSSSDSSYIIVSSSGVTYQYYPESNFYKRVNTQDTQTKPTESDEQEQPRQTDKQSVTVKKVASGTKYETELYVIESGKPGPVVMIVGGVHGNEKAGYTAAHKVADYNITRGTLLVLPEANKRAVDRNRRYVKGEGDLNRDFPTTKSGRADGVLSRAILKTMKNYDVDWVMDMHEGYDYSKKTTSSSVGQSIIYYPSSKMTPLAKDIVNSLNKNISTSYKKFSLLRYPVKGSLARSAAVACGANSFIFETCSKQKLSTRVNYQLKAVNMLLDDLNMR